MTTLEHILLPSGVIMLTAYCWWSVKFPSELQDFLMFRVGRKWSDILDSCGLWVFLFGAVATTCWLVNRFLI